MRQNITANKRKHYIIPVVILFIIGGAGFGGWYYFFKSPEKKEHFQKFAPKIETSRITVTEIDGERIKFTARIGLTGKFPFDITMKNIQYNIYIDTAMIAQSDYGKALTLNSSGKTYLTFAVELSMKRLTNILNTLKAQQLDSATYRAEIKTRINLPIVKEKEFDFTLKKRMPFFRMPEISLEETDIEKLGLKTSAVNMVFRVQNPNRFPLKLNNGTFSVSVDNKLDMSGEMKEFVNVPALGSSTIPVHVDIKSRKIGTLVWKAIFDKEKTSFQITFKGIAESENEILDSTNIVITGKSTVAKGVNTVKSLK